MASVDGICPSTGGLGCAGCQVSVDLIRANKIAAGDGPGQCRHAIPIDHRLGVRRNRDRALVDGQRPADKGHGIVGRTGQCALSDRIGADAGGRGGECCQRPCDEFIRLQRRAGDGVGQSRQGIAIVHAQRIGRDGNGARLNGQRVARKGHRIVAACSQRALVDRIGADTGPQGCRRRHRTRQRITIDERSVRHLPGECRDGIAIAYRLRVRCHGDGTGVDSQNPGIGVGECKAIERRQ